MEREYTLADVEKMPQHKFLLLLHNHQRNPGTSLMVFCRHCSLLYRRSFLGDKMFAVHVLNRHLDEVDIGDLP